MATRASWRTPGRPRSATERRASPLASGGACPARAGGVRGGCMTFMVAASFCRRLGVWWVSLQWFPSVKYSQITNPRRAEDGPIKCITNFTYQL